MASKSEFADAYKLKPDVLEKRNARLQRRSIEWKNLRYEEVGKRRKIDLENLSPLQEQDQNISNISKSYPDKTPVKVPKDNEENKPSKRETISQRTQRLLQWKQEKEKKKAAEKAKKKPSFKVTGVQHKDIDVFSKDNKVAKAKVTHNTTVNRPTRVKKEVVPKPPPAPVHVQKPTTRSQPTRTAANSKQSAVQSKPSTAKPQQTIRVTRQTRSAAKLKGSPKSATRTASKTQKTTKSNLSAVEKKPSPEYDVSLHKVSTLRGASFAPTDFTFEAPDSLKSFAFQPLSPASAASFLDPNRDLTSTSFFSHDPSVGRCSTPKSQDENSMDQSERAVDETLKAGQDSTTVEAMTTPKRQTRTRSGHSTATSSESESDTVSNVTAVKVASGRKSRKPVKSSDSDDSHSSVSSGNTSKSSRSRSRQKDTTVVELSEQKDGEVERDSKKSDSDTQDPTTSANTSKSSGRKSVRQETESALSEVASPAKVTKVETVTEATTPQKDNKTEDVPEKEAPETAEPNVVKTPKTSRRLSVRKQNEISENDSETVSEATAPKKETTKDVTESEGLEKVETKLVKTPRRRSVRQQNELETVSKATTPKKETTEDVAESKETEPVETKVVKTSKTPRRRSVRQQNANSESESEKTEKEEKQAKTPRRRSVRGRRKSESEDEAVVAESAKTPRTPKRSLRKSSNTSVLESCEPVAAMEVIEEEQETDDVFQTETKKEQNNPSEEKTVEDAKTDVNNDNCTPARSRRCSTSDACFRQPGLPMSAQRSGRKRRRTESSAEECGAARSPEEWVKILSTSPMVEMRRRTPKAPRLAAEPISQSLNFDDIIDEPMDLEVSGGKDKTAPETAEKNVIEVVAEKVSSPSKPEATAAEETKTEGEHDVPYFRNLLITETARLNVFSEDWTKISQTGGMSEEVEGEIRTTVGQAQLLIAQRFKQFTGLVDNCEFGTGEKETTCTDLQGFWDMIYFQVEDVDKKFAQLTELQKNNWKQEEKQAVKKVLKKKAAVTVKPKVKGGPSKFAAFRAQMKKQKEEVAAEAASGQEEPVKVFDAGFFKVSSPVKSPAPHCEGGTPSKQKPNTDSGSEETKTETLVLPQEVDVPKTLLMKTPKRKSYVPSVPSPLLRDITPKQKPRKSLSSAPTSATKKESDTSPLSIFTPPQQDSPQPVSLFTPPTGNTPKNQTPKRRSIRLRKSLTLTPTVEEQRELASKTEEGGLDPRFFQPSEGSMETDEHNASTDLAKFLAPTTPAQSTEELDTSFTKFLQPTEERLPTGGKKSALKKLPSSQRLRSRRSVQFAPSLDKSPESHSRLPSTPYSRDSIVPKQRVSHGECYLFTPPSEDDADQISPAEGSSPVLKGRPRPSLLFTPAKPESSGETETDNLMVFTPSPK